MEAVIWLTCRAALFYAGAPPSCCNPPRLKNFLEFLCSRFLFRWLRQFHPASRTIVSVGFEQVTSNGTTAIGSAYYITNNVWGGLWNNVLNGSYTITAVATDASGRTTASPSITITVDPINLTNHPPVVTNVQFTIQENSVNNVLNPLAHDYDPDGDPLKIIGIIEPTFWD